MGQEGNPIIMGGEVSLRDLLIVLLQKWWVVAIVFVVTVVGAAAISFRTSDVYEARTSLLLETALPLEILSSPATSDTLLQSIISELDLRDPATGDSLGIQQLANMVKVDSQTTAQRGTQLGSHLFTLTVQGGPPELLKAIADKWAQLFAEQSNLLFVEEANRSYDIAFNRFQEASKALREKEDEKLAYQRANPVATYQSQLTVLTAQYQDYLQRLQNNRTALLEAQASLKSDEEAFAEEPQFLEVERAISQEALLALLASNPNEQAIDDISNLVIVDQEPNELYFSLKSEIVSLRTSIARLDANITYLESLTAELEKSLEQVSSRYEEARLNLSRIDQDIGILTDNFTQLSKSLQDAQIVEGGQQEFIQVVEPAVEPESPLPKQGRMQTLLVGAALGLILGVTLAFLIHYLQNPTVHNQQAQ